MQHSHAYTQTCARRRKHTHIHSCAHTHTHTHTHHTHTIIVYYSLGFFQLFFLKLPLWQTWMQLRHIPEDIQKYLASVSFIQFFFNAVIHTQKNRTHMNSKLLPKFYNNQQEKQLSTHSDKKNKKIILHTWTGVSQSSTLPKNIKSLTTETHGEVQSQSLGVLCFKQQST